MVSADAGRDLTPGRLGVCLFAPLTLAGFFGKWAGTGQEQFNEGGSPLGKCLFSEAGEFVATAPEI